MFWGKFSKEDFRIGFWRGCGKLSFGFLLKKTDYIIKGDFQNSKGAQNHALCQQVQTFIQFNYAPTMHSRVIFLVFYKWIWTLKKSLCTNY